MPNGTGSGGAAGAPSTDQEKARKRLQDHFAGTYFALRVGVAVIGIALPVALALGGRFLDGEALRGSMSAYYYSPSMRDIFVGALVAIGVSLALYRGFSSLEDWVLNAGGLLVVGVAMVPTAEPGTAGGLGPWLHGLFALLFFGCIGYVAIFRGPDTLALLRNTRTAWLFRGWYAAIGAIMWIVPLSVLVLSLMAGHPSWVYFVEAAGVWAFSAYWMVKSYEMHLTNAEQLAVQGRLAPTPKRQVVGRLIQAAPEDDWMEFDVPSA